MRIFLSGIIQGSHAGTQIHDQDYRDELKEIIREWLPAAEVVCPIDRHPNGIAYGPEDSRRAFFGLVEEAAAADIVIAYIPEASMGTAIEMWEAHKAGRPVVTITPLRHNWVVNLLSARVFGTAAEFAAFIQVGGLEELASPTARKDAETAGGRS